MATQVFLDTFDEASDVELSVHTPDVGTGWTQVEGTTTLRTESVGDFMRASGGSASDRTLYVAGPSPVLSGADYDVVWTVLQPAAPDDPAFAIARYVDVNNYYTAGNDGARYAIVKRVGGVATVLAETAGQPVANDVLTFELRGTALRLLLNSVAILTVTDGDLTATGAPGFGMGNAWDVASDDIASAWQIDNYEVIDQSGAAFDPSADPVWTPHALPLPRRPRRRSVASGVVPGRGTTVDRIGALAQFYQGLKAA